MNLPPTPKTGEKIEASFMRRVLDYIRSITVSAGPGLRVNRTAAGTTITLAPKPEEPAKKADDAVLAQVTSGSNGTGYRVNLFANGKSAPSTGSGVMFVPEVALDANLPVGTWVVAHAVEAAVTEEGEVQ